MTKITQPPECGLTLIRLFESYSNKAYPDPKTGGKPITIGWGSTRDLNGNPFKLGDVISQTQADILFIDECEDILEELYEIPYYDEMSAEQVGALMSFAYNLGKHFYGSGGFDTITRRLKNREWHLVPDALLLYVNPGTNVEAGLKRRRKAEGELWTSGLKSKKTTITAKVPTFLKKKMVQSSALSNTEKVSVPPGKKFSILNSGIGDSKHTAVALDYNMGAWFVFNDHWDL